MARIESIPDPICERDGCDRVAKMRVRGEDSRLFGDYCSQHAVPALRDANDREKPHAPKPASDLAVSR